MLATLLCRAGVRVVLFRKGKRPPIIVGESMVPAVVPFLRQLGIEEEVAAYSVWKGGATFVLTPEQRLSVRFDEVRGAHTTYSYNVPRDQFDASILRAAERAGTVVLDHPAHLELAGGDRVALDAASVAAAGDALDGRQPDWIVDAGGRARTLARLLDLPTITGERRDTALHAHVTGVEVEVPGNVHTDRLEHGWAWRIPLPDRVSVGLVIDPDHLRTFGDTAEEQYDACLRSDPSLRTWARPATRVTPVVRYSNYQLRTTRGVGPNWALVGDAFGFIDPVFSSGMLIALESAEALAGALLDGAPETLAAYERDILHKLECWQRIANYFYSGRLLTLFRVGEVVKDRFWGRLLDFHFRKHMPRIFTGEGTTNRYSQWLVGFMVNRGLYGHDPDELRIH
jgi:hypothetical protein